MYRSTLIAAAALMASATVASAQGVCGAGGLTLTSGCAALPNARQGANYRATLSTAGCTQGNVGGGGTFSQCSVGWTITGLPANLTYQTVTTGNTVITGIPTTPGTYALTIQATDMKAAGGACTALATPLPCNLVVDANLATIPPEYVTLGNNQRADFVPGGADHPTDDHTKCFVGSAGNSAGVGALAALLALAAVVGLAVRR